MSNNENTGWMNVTDFCIQRRRRLEFNRPPPRLNSMITNPYLTYSKEEMDMRRKAEVLKYSAVSTNSKTNNLTKAEKYAQLVKISKGNGSYNRIAKIQETCPYDELIKTPNYSCDVPGPYTLLYMDEKVELYNYGKGNTTVAVQNPTPITEPYTYVLYDNVASEDNTVVETLDNVFDKSIQVASLYINSSDKIQEYNYKYPVTFDFTNENGITVDTPVSITVEDIFVYVYYNKTLISTNDKTVSFNPPPNISIPTIVFDNYNFPGSGDNSYFNIQSSSTTFSGHVYLGTVGVEKLQLCNQPHIIYDIRIVIYYTTNPGNIIRYKTLSMSYSDIKSYANPNLINIRHGLFESADVSATTKVENLFTTLLEPKNQTLNIITQENRETVSFGINANNEKSYVDVNFNGENWWNNINTFPNTGFIDQLE